MTSPLDQARAAVAARPSTRRPGGDAGEAARTRWDGWEANRRRTEAARRLPPMPCGCRDPFTNRHREGRCKWRRRGAA